MRDSETCQYMHHWCYSISQIGVILLIDSLLSEGFLTNQIWVSSVLHWYRSGNACFVRLGIERTLHLFPISAISDKRGKKSAIFAYLLWNHPIPIRILPPLPKTILDWLVQHWIGRRGLASENALTFVVHCRLGPHPWLKNRWHTIFWKTWYISFAKVFF